MLRWTQIVCIILTHCVLPNILPMSIYNRYKDTKACIIAHEDKRVAGSQYTFFTNQPRLLSSQQELP